MEVTVRKSALGRNSRRSPRAALEKVPAKVSVTALAHTGEELIPARPAFMYKEGLTGAEQGSALHAFLQHADLAAHVDVAFHDAALVAHEAADGDLLADLGGGGGDHLLDGGGFVLEEGLLEQRVHIGGILLGDLLGHVGVGMIEYGNHAGLTDGLQNLHFIEASHNF